MRNLIIIGAGGMGREVYNLATQCPGNLESYRIKGFLDDNLKALNAFKVYPPVLGTINNYDIEEDDIFACSVGNVQIKRKLIDSIRDRGGEFISLIHPTSLINTTALIGEGCIVYPYTQIGSHAVIGNYVLVQSYATIAHDAIIGNYSRIDVQVVCVGSVIVGDAVTIHSGAVINHKVVIGDNAVVGAMSFVIRKVKKGTTVFGNPAIEL
jgi:sugar O-acyltransferase (sialic acid O-acetyltransferase NeuD family)